MYDFTLSFDLIKCPSCGKARPAMATCRECGDATLHPDPALRRRQQVVRGAREALKAVGSNSAEPLELGDAIQQFHGWLEEFMTALSESVRNQSDDGSSVATAASKLGRLRSQLDAVQRLRPSIETWRAVDRVLGQLAAIAEAYFVALEATDPEDAQAMSSQAQQLLDEGAAEVELLNARLQRLRILEGTASGEPIDNTGVMARLAYQATGSTNVLQADEAGAALFKRLDPVEPCPRGFGVSLLLAELSAENIMDATRYWDVARRTYELLKDNPHLLVVARDSAWRHDMNAALTELSDAGLQAARLLPNANDRLSVRAMIGLGKSLTEIVAKPLLGAILACRRQEPYGRNRDNDVGTLLTEIVQARLQVLTYGLDRAIRDADAHGVYRLEPGRVTFQSRRREYDALTNEELADRVIGALESVSAMVTGLNAALLAAGVDADDLPSPLFDPPEQVGMVLIANGIRPIEISLGPTTEIRGEGTMPSQSLALGTLMLPFLPEACERVIIRLDDNGHERTASIPIAAAKLWNAATEGVEKDSAFVRAARLTTVDDIPLLSRSESRRWIAAMSRDAQALAPRDAIRQLRVLRALAESLDETEGVALVEDHMRAMRVAITEGSSDALEGSLKRLTEWSGQ